MKKIWLQFKKWFIQTGLDWIKKGWLHTVNLIIVLIAYGSLDNHGIKIAWLVGFWGFILLGYWIFWKFFGAEKLFKPKEKSK